MPAFDKAALRKDIARDQRAQARARVAAMKADAKSACAEGRVAARVEGHALKERAKSDAKTLREKARGSCEEKKRSVAEERKYQRELRKSEAANRASARASRASSATRRAESDDEVRGNIPPELVPLFDRVKRSIKASPRRSRTEAFLEYVEAHPGEEYAAIDDATDALIADLERQQRAGRTNPRAASHVVLGSLTELVVKEGRATRAMRWPLERAPLLAFDNGGKRLFVVYGAKDVRPSGFGERRRYRVAHWGEEGKAKVGEGAVASAPFVVVGEGVSVTYTTRKGDEGKGELVDYRHTWGDGARGSWTAPTVVRHACPRGKGCAHRHRLALRGGTYRVTAHGIVG